MVAGYRSCSRPFSMLLMWTWVRGTGLLAAKTHRDSISTRGLIAMLQKSKPVRVPGTAIFLDQRSRGGAVLAHA